MVKIITIITIAALVLLAIYVVFVELSIKTFYNLFIGTYDILCKYDSNKLLTTQLQCFKQSHELFLLVLPTM